MSLKVVEQYFGETIARATARHMEYPYSDSDARRIQPQACGPPQQQPVATKSSAVEKHEPLKGTKR